MWKCLPLSVAGRCNVIKMIWMPQLLYVLHNSPIWLYKKWFQRTDTLFREMIWKDGPATIQLSTLQCQKQEGGVALPHPFSYILASQIQHMGGCNFGGQEVGRKRLLQNTPHDSIVEALEAGSFPSGLPTLNLMMRVWDTVKVILKYDGLTEYTPLWENSKLGELQKTGVVKDWKNCGIKSIFQLYVAGSLKTYQDLRAQYSLQNKSFFRYLQVRHALGEQFRGKTLKWSKIPELQKVINSETGKGLISKIYSHINKGRMGGMEPPLYRINWEKDVRDISETQWIRILELAPLVSLSPSQRMSHLFLLYRTYYTPP